jgi:hypothetical protein
MGRAEMDMSRQFDHLIVGSTLLARLTALLLAEMHGARVVLVADSASPLAVPPLADIATTLVTRPDTGAMVAALGRELGPRLFGFEPGSAARVESLALAETAESMTALGHVAHLFSAIGIEADLVADHRLNPEGLVLRHRGAIVLKRASLARQIDVALRVRGVHIMAPATVQLTLYRDGTAALRQGDLEYGAATTLIADDEAALAHLGPKRLDAVLRPVDRLALLLRAGPTMAAPALFFVDRGVRLIGLTDQPLLALISGPVDTAEARLASALADDLPLRPVGRRRVTALMAKDGSPFVGPARGLRTLVATGFGPVGFVFAPLMARLLANRSTAAEVNWLRRHGRGAQRPVDFAGALG